MFSPQSTLCGSIDGLSENLFGPPDERIGLSAYIRRRLVQSVKDEVKPSFTFLLFSCAKNDYFVACTYMKDLARFLQESCTYLQKFACYLHICASSCTCKNLTLN